jgi:hypothetical protein
MKKIIKKTTDSAIVGIVTAMLIVSLIVTVIAIVQLVYIPIIMEQREAEHMDRVAEQFGFLTSVIDDQAADERKGIPIAAFVTLGSKELPFLVSSKASGTLEILENSCAININNSPNPYQIGTIKYSSTNAYFLDQSYNYETGAMIVSQSSGNLMMIRPGFSIDFNETYEKLNISFVVVNISSIGNKTIAAGSGTCGIQTEYRNISVDKTYTQVSKISIYSSNSNAWYVFLKSSFKQAELNLEEYGVNLTLNSIGQTVTINFKPGYFVELNVFFKIINIEAQIGPGWID